MRKLRVTSAYIWKSIL